MILLEWLMRLDDLLMQHTVIVFLFLAFMLKCLLVSFYCLIIYWMMCLVKRIWGKKMSIRANYYSWYALFLSFPLSGLGFNNVIKLPFYDMFFGSYTFVDFNPEYYDIIERFTNISGLLKVLLFLATMVWLAIVLVKCLQQTVIKIQLQRDISRQNKYDDREGLKLKAAAAFGLHPEKIQVVSADFIRSPVSYGVISKTILMPHDYESRYTIPEQYLLLLHEMGHIKNHDTVKLQLIAVAQCFIWPLRFMTKYFIRDSEILCDNRVLGIYQDQQDTYGELMVRECSSQRAVKGLGFSDSFHTIKSRLEAIYSHKPEKHRIAVFAVAVAFLLAGAAVYASWHPADWLKTVGEDEPMYIEAGTFDVLVHYPDLENGEIIAQSAHEINITYETEGELVEFSSESMKETPEYQAVSNTYSYTDKQLLVDKVALYKYLLPYIEEGLDVIEVEFITLSPHYIDTIRGGMVWGGTAGCVMHNYRTYTITRDELEQADESSPCASFTYDLIREELIYRFVAHWL